MEDEIDVAAKKARDTISLDPGDDEGESVDDEDDFAGVMDIDADDDSDDGSDDSSEEEEEEEKEEEDDDDQVGAADSEDDEEDAALIRAMKAQQKKLNSKGATRARHDDDSDDDEDESEDEDGALAVRGKKKSDFYGGDEDIDHEGLSDEEERQEEEREARRMQKTMAEGMSAADYGLSDDDDDDDSSSEEDQREATLGAKAKKLTAKGKAATAKASVKRTAELKANGGIFGEGAAIESLGADEMAAAAGSVVASDAPELIALTKDLTKNLDEVRHSIEPVIAAVRNGEYATAEGISYLDAKHLLMLSYCINIVFYLLLKSEGKPVKDHPVVLRLVELRTYLEKLRPIDRKLQYQVRCRFFWFSFCRLASPRLLLFASWA